LSDRIGLLTVGPLAEQALSLVADGADRHRLVPLASASELADAQESFERLVVGLWRPAPALCRQLDALAAERGFSWLPAELDGRTLRVGPWCTASGPVCFSCYYERRRQHDEKPAMTAEIHRAYDRDADLGPRGHLPHHARFMAGLIQEALAAPRSAEVGSLNLDTLRVSRHAVTPTADCARCWASADEAAARDLAQAPELTLAAVVANLAKESFHAAC
jgi:bacteriocin biosynthesis cyclodehydratase domain-containing protein